MRTQLPTNVANLVQANPNVKRYLVSLTKEAKPTPRSWVYDGHNSKFMEPDEILQAWLKYLDAKKIAKLVASGDRRLKVRDSAPDRLAAANEFADRVIQLETSQIEKYGPQGGHKPVSEALDDVVLPTYSLASRKRPPAFESANWARAKEIVIRKLQAAGCVNLRPASPESVVDDMKVRDTLSSNSGLPDFARRKSPEVKARAILDCKTGQWKNYPAILLFRYYNGKLRPVWMYPMSANLAEGRFFQPFFSTLAKSRLSSEFFAPWLGFEACRAQITSHYARKSLLCLMATDFSSTDAHFQSDATSEVFQVMEKCFQRQFAEELRTALMHMHSIELLIGPDDMLTGPHGVSSGSMFTNLVETIFDMILAEFLKLEFPRRIREYVVSHQGFKSSYMPLINKAHLDWSGVYAIGDDQLYALIVEFSKAEGHRADQVEGVLLDVLPHLVSDIASEVGMEIKLEKTTAERNSVKTLQRLSSRFITVRNESGTGGQQEMQACVYPTVRALKSIVYPERWHKPKGDGNSTDDVGYDKNMFAIRCFMIMENCVDHPLFQEFVEFVCRGNRHLIDFARLKDSQIDTLYGKSKSIPGLTATYTQESKLTSLSRFKSISIAKSL
nr:MAG: putative RNA-dependent RNA polymerase [Picobirnavirus sp.]